jgi:uncharacterized protein involved in response to NO
VRVSTGAGEAARPRWRWRHVLDSPHRLGFLLGMAVLGASGAWWALVQLDRSGLGPQLPYARSPSITHGAAMVFGFMPLFFGGFLFTAGPRWLALPPEPAASLVAPFGAQAAGWLLWLAGAHAGTGVAVAGLLLVQVGMATVTWRFARRVHASRASDRLHPRAIAYAHAIGVACLTGLLAATLAGADGVGLAFVLAGLWWFVVPVFLTAADRLIPFFSAEALPSARWPLAHHSLALLLALSALEGAGAWLDLFAGRGGWMLALGAAEALAAIALLALAVAWGRVKRLSSRLLAMFHAGLLWLGMSFALAAAGHLLPAADGAPVLPLAGLHALTMGCLGSLMLAMVSRISAGHGGRPQVTDDWLWVLFWLLQAATVLRLAATVRPVQALLTAAALLWAGTMLAWGLRHANWYGHPRYERRR